MQCAGVVCGMPPSDQSSQVGRQFDGLACELNMLGIPPIESTCSNAPANDRVHPGPPHRKRLVSRATIVMTDSVRDGLVDTAIIFLNFCALDA